MILAPFHVHVQPFHVQLQPALNQVEAPQLVFQEWVGGRRFPSRILPLLFAGPQAAFTTLNLRKPARACMTAPLEIESEVLLQRLVREHETVIARCFHGSDEVDSDLYDSLAAASSAVLCRIKLSTVAAAGLPLPDHVGGEGGEGEGDMEVVQEAWWLFFRGGETVGQTCA